jgi:hypothetical protein
MKCGLVSWQTYAVILIDVKNMHESRNIDIVALRMQQTKYVGLKPVRLLLCLSLATGTAIGKKLVLACLKTL